MYGGHDLASIPEKLVRQLKHVTGATMTDCRAALMETGGDLEKATAFLREHGIEPVAKETAPLACVEIRLSIVCQSCNSLVAVNGPLRKVRCARCGAGQALHDRFGWHNLLNFGNPGIDVFKWAVVRTDRKSETGAISSIKLEASRRWPRCVSCGKRFEGGAVASSVQDGRGFLCVKCNTTTPLVPAPRHIMKPFACALYIAGGEEPSVPKGPVADARGEATSPAVPCCASCGSPLDVNADERNVTCSFCGARNHLPDLIWRRMHPPEKSRPWHILYDPKLVRTW